MEGTGGELLSDTFCSKHHAMPVPPITPTDCILAATKALTAAISGIQETPPNELQAITTLRHLLLGETPHTPVPINAPSVAPPPLTAHNYIDEERVHIWDLTTQSTRQPSSVVTTPHPTSDTTMGPAIINDDENDDPYPHASCSPRPIRMRAQHRSTHRHIHLINLVITTAQLPTTSFPALDHVASTRALLKNTYGVIQNINPTSSSNSLNFISIIVDNITGNVLEYRHLIKSDKLRTIWQMSFANKLGRLFQGIHTIKGTDTCYFIHRKQIPQRKHATYRCIVCNYRPQEE
jgi:hypothetical protein